MPRETVKAYSVTMTLLLASIAIKYGGLNTNPFQQQSNPTMLLFLTAILCHAVASTAPDPVNTATTIIFHASGVIACESLLWILLLHFWWFIIINVLLLLVVPFCFFYDNIFKLPRALFNHLCSFYEHICKFFNAVFCLLCRIFYEQTRKHNQSANQRPNDDPQEPHSAP